MRVRTPVRREWPGTALGIVGSAVVHAGAVAGLVYAAERPGERMLPPAYAVELVAAPRPEPQIKRAAPEALPTPPAEKPVPLKPPLKRKAPAPPEPKVKSPPQPERKEPPAPTRAPEAPLPNETPGSGTDVANVKTPGLEFPYPEYLRNIVAQVYRRWDRPSGSRRFEAAVSFLVLRDGTVREVKLVRSSGNFAFDLGAQGAVEAAGNAKAFGPLPEGYPADVLPVTFLFTPTPQ